MPSTWTFLSRISHCCPWRGWGQALPAPRDAMRYPRRVDCIVSEVEQLSPSLEPLVLPSPRAARGRACLRSPGLGFAEESDRKRGQSLGARAGWRGGVTGWRDQWIQICKSGLTRQTETELVWSEGVRAAGSSGGAVIGDAGSGDCGGEGRPGAQGRGNEGHHALRWSL